MALLWWLCGRFFGVLRGILRVFVGTLGILVGFTVFAFILAYFGCFTYILVF